MKRILYLLLIFSKVGFGQEKLNIRPVSLDSSVNLYAFVGHKGSIIEYDPNKEADPSNQNKSTPAGGGEKKRSFYNEHRHFYATYRLVQNVFNELEGDSVHFKAYERLVHPGFSPYSTVLLYVSKSSDAKSLYHQQGQFDELVKNDKGEWVGKNGESLKQLFEIKRKTVFKERGLFK
jgi:hypothetical protein